MDDNDKPRRAPPNYRNRALVQEIAHRSGARSEDARRTIVTLCRLIKERAQFAASGDVVLTLVGVGEFYMCETKPRPEFDVATQRRNVGDNRTYPRLKFRVFRTARAIRKQ